MMRRVLIILAGLVYLAAMACSVGTGGDGAGGGGRGADGRPRGHAINYVSDAARHAGPEGAHAPDTQGLPFCGIDIQLQRVDWMDKYKQSIEKIAALGADTVLFVMDMRQENGSSSQIYLDMRMTPTGPQLADLIKHAKDRKLRVVLMPIVLLDHPKGQEWRGSIHPEDPGAWWDSYRSALRHYATLAAEGDADMLVVGSELVTMETKDFEWRRVIKEVRSIYKGKLTYSSNWDHYQEVHFWDQLDMIGMNSYWTLGKDARVTVDEIVDKWHEIQKDLLDFHDQTGKPLFFTEIGWFSQSNSAAEPWNYTREEMPIDMELQRRLYQAFFEAWYGNPALGGFCVWEWSPNGGAADYKGEIPPDAADEALKRWRGYTPEGKPAEKVLRDWLAKPRWEVK